MAETDKGLQNDRGPPEESARRYFDAEVTTGGLLYAGLVAAL